MNLSSYVETSNKQKCRKCGQEMNCWVKIGKDTPKNVRCECQNCKENYTDLVAEVGGDIIVFKPKD